MGTPSKLELIRDRCVERARSKDDFRGVAIISRKKGDLFTLMFEAMAKSGVCILVSVPTALPKPWQTEQVVLDPVNIIFEISENVPVNQASTGTGKGAMYLAERIAANFQLWPPLPDDPVNAGVVLMPKAPGIIELPAPQQMQARNGIDPKTLYILAVHFETTCTLSPATP